MIFTETSMFYNVEVFFFIEIDFSRPNFSDHTLELLTCCFADFVVSCIWMIACFRVKMRPVMGTGLIVSAT